MGSSGKKKTTMAKLNRERKMREKRMDKLARKDARKLAAENPAPATDDTLGGRPDDTVDQQSDAPDGPGAPPRGVDGVLVDA